MIKNTGNEQIKMKTQSRASPVDLSKQEKKKGGEGNQNGQDQEILSDINTEKYEHDSRTELKNKPNNLWIRREWR